MSIITVNPVTVGAATKKDHYDAAFNNTVELYQTMLAGLPFRFGGTATVPTTNTALPSGATFDKLAPDTEVFNIDTANLPPGTYKLEAMLAVEGGATVTLSLVNLSDGAPDTPMVSITSTSATGQLVQSAAISFTAVAGAAKNYGVKISTSNAANRAWAWGIRLIRTV